MRRTSVRVCVLVRGRHVQPGASKRRDSPENTHKCTAGKHQTHPAAQLLLQVPLFREIRHHIGLHGQAPGTDGSLPCTDGWRRDLELQVVPPADPRDGLVAYMVRMLTARVAQLALVFRHLAENLEASSKSENQRHSKKMHLQPLISRVRSASLLRKTT